MAEEKQRMNITRTLKRIVNKHTGVFEGIGKHKYRQVLIVTPINQPQRTIPFAKRLQLDAILDKLESAGVIEEVDGAHTEIRSNANQDERRYDDSANPRHTTNKTRWKNYNTN